MDEEKNENKLPENTDDRENSNNSEEFRNYADDPKLAKAAVEFVKDLHGNLRKKRKPFEQMWAECQEAFRTIERKTYFQGTMPYCSSDLRDAVLSIVPKLAKAVWYKDIPFDLVPIGEKGDDDKLAEINQKVLEWDFRNLKIYLKYVDGLFQKAIYGTNIIKTPPHFEMITRNLRSWSEMKIAGQTSLPGKKTLNRKQELERVFMGTDYNVVDLFDFWIDPTTITRGIKDAVQYGDCIESICLKKTDLLEGKKSGIYLNIDKIEDKYIGAKKSLGADTSIQQRVKRAGHVQGEAYAGAASLTKIERGNKLYEVKECYADFDLGNGLEPVLITIGADIECLRLQKWDGDKPYLSSRYIPNGYNKEFYGTGIIENNLSNHYERNATRKQIISARTMGLNMEMLSSQAGFPNKPDRLRTAPNKIHFVKDINAIKPFEKPIGPILQTALAHETNIKAETQQSTGNTPYIQGNDTSKINDTAHGIQILQAAGNEKFSLPLQVDETGMLEPYVKRCLENNVTYRKESFVIRLTDKRPIRVEPEQLSANFDVYSKGSSEIQNKQLRQEGLEKAWGLSIQAAPLEAQIYGKPLTKFPELKKELFANLGLSQPETFIVDLNDQNKMQILTPEMEQILIQRMGDGSAPPQPILIQPGEDHKDHYENHLSFTATEEFQRLPDQIKQIWYSHIRSYEPVLKYIEDQKKELIKDEEIQKKEVAVSV